MPDFHILNSVKVSLSNLVPTHAMGDLPASTRLDALGVEATLFRRLLIQCAIALSNDENGSIRSSWLQQKITAEPGLTIAGFSSALEEALASREAFARCPAANLPETPNSSQCNTWRQGPVACRILLAIEDWADPASLALGIGPSRTLQSFHGNWNVGFLAALVEATNARQVFAPFFHERMEFPPNPVPGSTKVSDWAKLVLRLRTPVTKCP